MTLLLNIKLQLVFWNYQGLLICVCLPLILIHEEVQALPGFAFALCLEWSPPSGSVKQQMLHPCPCYKVLHGFLQKMHCMFHVWNLEKTVKGAIIDILKCRLKRLYLHQMQICGLFLTPIWLHSARKTNLWLDNAFINDTNIFCPRCLHREMFHVRIYSSLQERLQ